MEKIAVIGGGAAGMMASIFAARRGMEVHVYEKNEKTGKKLYITGKGRCNLTNACDMEELLESVESNKKFLYSAFYGFTNQDAYDFFEAEGLKLKVERGNRVFPMSDRSADVLDTLRRAMRSAGVQVHLNTEVKSVRKQEDGFTLQLADKTIEQADKVIVATGGISYESTGSTGDGYRFAESFGLKVTDCVPSLVPFNVKEDWVKELQGLSLKNVSIKILDGKKRLYEDFGEMMFTHFGVTGPLILSASAQIGKKLEKEPLQAFLDLKPALDAEQLDARILREFDANHNKQFKNVIGVLFPSSLTPIMIEIGGIPGEKPVHEISREERQAFGRLIKAFPFTITGMGEFKEAIITRGGVSVKEIQPSTMESKKVKNLYFTGEVLDLDAVTGGYNLQIAWSTAYLAAQAIQ